MRDAMKSILASTLGLAACARPSSSSGPHGAPAPSADLIVKGGAGERSLVLAGGCFWCVEAVFEEIEGVREVESGFAGGAKETADYESVSSGRTDHAEAVRIVYDSARVSFGTLLQIFFSTHDPTTKDRQGPDAGRQYRSAIFFTSEDERRMAAEYIRELEAKKAFSAPIVTTLEPFHSFYPAEAYHQDFVARNPKHPYVVAWSLPKLEKLEKLFPEKTKRDETP